MDENVELRAELEEKKKIYKLEHEELNKQLLDAKHKMDVTNLEHNETLLKMENIQDELNKHQALEAACSKKTTEVQTKSSEARRSLLNSYKSPKKFINQVFADSDSDDEMQVSQTISPRKTPKKTTNAAILGITPQKAGISKFNPAECSLIDWLNSLETTIDWLRSSNVDDSQIIRLIVMSLPTSLSWVGNHIDEDAKNNLPKATKNLIQLIMGSQGTISDFLSSKKMLQEHPLSYLHRLRKYLEASNININDSFAIKSTLDRLYQNLDQTTVVELKRKLVNITRFDDITRTLKEVVQLTHNNEKVSSMINSLSITDVTEFDGGNLDSIQPRRKVIGPCFGCGETGHLKRDCKNRSPQKMVKHGNQRETKTEKDGRRFWCKNCGKNNTHSTKYCKKTKKPQKTD